MVREEDIRTAFSKVREDIIEIKRSINKNIFRIDDLSGIVGQLTTKEEFYAFVEKLNTKLDQFERGFADKREMEKFTLSLKERVDFLKALIDKREKVIDQIREIQKVKGKLADFQAEAATKDKLREEMQSVDRQLSEIRKQLSDEATVSKYGADLKEFRDILAELTKDSVSWKELQKTSKSFEGKIAQQRNEISALKEDVTRFESEAVRIQPLHDWLEDVKSAASRLDEDVKVLKNDVTPKKDFEEKFRQLKSEIAALGSKIEGSLVETDLNDYATKEQLKGIVKRLQSELASSAEVSEAKQGIKALEQYATDVIKAKDEIEKLRKETESLQKQIIPEAEVEALTEDVKQLGKEVSQLREERKSYAKGAKGYVGGDELKKLKDNADSLSEEVEQLGKEVSQLREERKGSAKEARGYAAGDDLKKLKDDVSYVMSNMAGSNELKQQEKDFAAEISALRNEIKELKKETKSSIAGVKTEVKKEAKEQQGIIAKMSKATMDFFTEEEEKKEPKKEKAPEEKEEGKSTLLIVGIIAILIIVAGISFYMAGQNKGATAGTVTTTIPSETSATPEASATEAAAPVENVTVPSEAGNQTIIIIEPAPEENITQPEAIVHVSENITEQANVTIPENVTEPEPNITVQENVTELTQEQLDEECIKTFECNRTEGGYLFDCYYDNLSRECRCYTGQREKCKEMQAPAVSAAPPAQKEPWYAVHLNYKYVIIVFIAGVILSMIYFGLKKRKNGEKDDKKDDKTPQKKKAKEAEKEERPAKKPIDEEVIDLKEFFEEKK
ncbi:MAG: hypothetical protein V1702_04590 [Candidatus Woesearchaeota archaeon]